MRSRPPLKSVVLPALVLLAVLAAGIWAQSVRRGDFGGDGIVGTDDMFDFARAYRNRQEPAAARAADLNEDGRVDEYDIFTFLREWNADRDRALAEKN